MRKLIYLIPLTFFACSEPNSSADALYSTDSLVKSSKNLFTGVNTQYYQDVNQVKVKEEFQDGKKSGTYKSWFKNGQLKTIGNFKNNKRVGAWKFFNEKGDLTYAYVYG